MLTLYTTSPSRPSHLSPRSYFFVGSTRLPQSTRSPSFAAFSSSSRASISSTCPAPTPTALRRLRTNLATLCPPMALQISKHVVRCSPGAATIRGLRVGVVSATANASCDHTTNETSIWRKGRPLGLEISPMTARKTMVAAERGQALRIQGWEAQETRVPGGQHPPAVEGEVRLCSSKKAL